MANQRPGVNIERGGDMAYSLELLKEEAYERDGN
jgi:hypothetical protein